MGKQHVYITVSYYMSLFFSQCIKAALQNQAVPTSQPAKDHTITDFWFVSFYCKHLFLLHLIKLFTQNSTCES